jgi:glycosyltransferase involved in cell wall biosynthesis
MKVSVVTISFNQARFLEQAIRSVLYQDYPDMEYIVVDPGSTDGSRDIIERYRDRIDKVILSPDSGPAEGLNKGFAQATGDIYGFINSDDALLPGAVTRVVKAYSKKPDADIVSGHLYMVGENNELIRSVRATAFDPERFVYGGVQVAQQSTFMLAQAFRDVGGFNCQNTAGWDGELFLELGIAGKRFVVINDYLAIFRMYGSSISGSGRLWEKHLRNCECHFRKVKGRLPRRPDAMWRAWYRVDKWRRDPAGLLVRVYDYFAGRRRDKIIIT